MLTIFSTPKPFHGHIATIQRNAIKSWTLLHPDCEVILIGDDKGTAESAKELGIRHEPRVLTNEYGTPYINHIFDRAQEMAKHGLLCYVNCDIILMKDFVKAAERVSSWRKAFLMVGRRWDTDITESWDFDQPEWERRLKALVLQKGKQRPPGLIDFFAFPQGIYYKNMAPFLIGRPFWDDWLIWKTRSLKIPVVDLSSSVMAVHQNHDYSHHPEGEKGYLYGKEAVHNFQLLGGGLHLYSTDDATHRLTSRGIKRNFIHWFTMLRRMAVHGSIFVWCTVLVKTLPVRDSIGLRKKTIDRFAAKIRLLVSR
jgi:hypothetical protein